MKLLVCLVFFFGVCYSSQRGYKDQHREKYGNRINSNKLNRVYRPCEFNDLDCIRRVFAQNSNCKPVKGPVDDPYTLDWVPTHFAFANVTFILKDAQVSGLNNWTIREFYLNKVTDKLVLEVVFQAITMYSPEALLRYHRRGKEYVELSDYSMIIYKDISLTLTVPHIKDLQLSDAHVYAYIPDSNPPFGVGTGLTDNSDPQIAAVYNAIMTNVAIILREILVFIGPVFMKAFLEGAICDF